jgi:hypothetical protein
MQGSCIETPAAGAEHGDMERPLILADSAKHKSVPVGRRSALQNGGLVADEPSDGGNRHALKLPVSHLAGSRHHSRLEGDGQRTAEQSVLSANLLRCLVTAAGRQQNVTLCVEANPWLGQWSIGDCSQVTFG